MSNTISLITLGVADVAKSTDFYERLGFVRSKKASQAAISFFQAGPVVLALFGREALKDDGRPTNSGVAMVALRLRRMSRAKPRSTP